MRGCPRVDVMAKMKQVVDLDDGGSRGEGEVFDLMTLSYADELEKALDTLVLLCCTSDAVCASVAREESGAKKASNLHDVHASRTEQRVVSEPNTARRVSMNSRSACCDLVESVKPLLAESFLRRHHARPHAVLPG